MGTHTEYFILQSYGAQGAPWLRPLAESDQLLVVHSLDRLGDQLGAPNHPGPGRDV
jgi:hypothetical protein